MAFATGKGAKYLDDYVYHNTLIIDGNQMDNGFDGTANYNETRDAPIIKNASKYRMSVIRATMNGLGRGLPMFIPQINLTSTNDNNDPNQTAYALAFSFQGIYTNASNVRTFPISAQPPVRYVQFVPENSYYLPGKIPSIVPAPIKNQVPIPFIIGTAYSVGEQVSYNGWVWTANRTVAANENCPTYTNPGAGTTPAFTQSYQTPTPPVWNATTVYVSGQSVTYNNYVWLVNIGEQSTAGSAPNSTISDPTGGPTVWTRCYYISIWTATTYSQFQSVVYGNNTWVVNKGYTSSTSPPALSNTWLVVTTPTQPSVWDPTITYTAAFNVVYNGTWWIVKTGQSSTAGVPPSTANSVVWTVVSTYSGKIPSFPSPIQSQDPDNPIFNNEPCIFDLGNPYYWVSSLQYWINLVNLTIYNPTDDLINLNTGGYLANPFSCCWGDLYWEMYLSAAVRSATDLDGFIDFTTQYPNLISFVNQFAPPQFIYDETTNTFSFFGDVTCFGNLTGTPYGVSSGTVNRNPFLDSTEGNQVAQTGFSSAVVRPFFNTNMYGLFANFPVHNWGSQTDVGAIFPSIDLPNRLYLTDGSTTTIGPEDCPPGYAYEVLFINQFVQNIADYRIPPQSGVSPLGYVGPSFAGVYWVCKQDFPSVDSLWSPIDGLFLTSTLIPVRREAMSKPINVGESDLGYSSTISPSSFEPIVFDLSLDLSELGCQQYRRFANFTPNAEFRLSDLGNSNEEIHSIDIKIWWRCRLNGKLYPVNMFNLSSVSVKFMFKNKEIVN